MKKLLVLALVLSSLATAGLQIGGYNGEQLMPSETVVLNIYSDEAIAGDLEYFALVVLEVNGNMAGGESLVPAYTGIFIMDDAMGAGAMPVPAGTNGPWGGVTLFPGETAIAAGSIIFDGIVFHCNSPEDAVVQLYKVSGLDWSLGALLDEVVIDQIPEPMTMVLLALGGLFIRRK